MRGWLRCGLLMVSAGEARGNGTARPTSQKSELIIFVLEF